MLIYILKSAACLAILFLFYKVFLEKENMHIFKRFYLLGALLFALIVPTIVFTEHVMVDPPQYINNQEQAAVAITEPNIPPALEADVIDIAPLLWIAYFFGMFFFGIKFLRNLVQIFRRIRRNPKYQNSSFVQVLLQETIPPHTFFNYIFLNKTKFESNEIPKEVILHEETHARQKHSLDVVFIELLQVIFWVNPFIYFFKKAIKLNHEFLADSAVLNKDIDAVTYQNTLLSFLSSESAKKYQPTLPNSINYSSIKKRFTIMKSKTSKTSVVLRSFLLLPLFALLLAGFTETKFVKVPMERETIVPEEISSPTYQEGATKEQVAEYNALAKKYYELPTGAFLPTGRYTHFNESELTKVDDIYNTMSDAQKKSAEPYPFLTLPKYPQEGATKEQVSEYNTLATKYNEMLQGDHFTIRKSDVDRLEYLHGLMTEEQRSNAEPFPDFPEPPPPPEAPGALGEEMTEMEREIASQEKAMAEQEGAMLEKEHAMEQQENAMKEKERAMVEQEVERERRSRNLLEPPPPPPSPKSPLDHVQEMAKKGADFYFDGEKISSERAIQILEKNKDINIHIKDSNKERPLVKLSTDPIQL